MNSADQADLEAILQSRPPEPRWLLPLLQAIQTRFRHLPESALSAVSARLKLPASQVFAVANFYKSFSLTPKAERIFTVCQGTACHLRGAPGLVKALEDALGASLGGTSADGKNGLESVNCLGACALAPVVTIGDEVHGRLDPKGAKKLATASDSDESNSDTLNSEPLSLAASSSEPGDFKAQGQKARKPGPSPQKKPKGESK